MGVAIERRTVNTPNFRAEARAPISGGNESVDPGGIWLDRSKGVTYVNAGSRAASYWYPHEDGGALWGFHSDFSDDQGKAEADTATEAILTASGLRVFGQGVEVNGDSGMVKQAGVEGGGFARISATDEIAHTIAVGTDAIFQPDIHGPIILETEVSQVSAITLRGAGFGFLGALADALDPAVTAATTVTTLVQDDLALLHFNVGYTDGDRYFVGHNKSNADATQSTATGGRDTGVNVAAAGTSNLLRAELTAAGDVRFFIDKVRVGTYLLALDADEETGGVYYLESTSTATKAADMRRFDIWAHRE